jgi:lysophospholipase L1-like esterase
MDIKEFKKIHYPDKKTHGERREIFNCRNRVYEVNEWKVDILFIGDSITERFEVYPYFNRYGTVVNRGIGGEATNALKERLFFDAILLNPKVCVVAEGVNNTAVLWRTAHEGKPVTEQLIDSVLDGFKSDMTYTVKTLKENGIIPIVGAVLPIGVKDVRNDVIIKENEFLKELCDAEGVAFVDYYKECVSDDGITMQDLTFGDDLHPHVMGYNKMAKLLYPVLDGIFGKEN